MDLDPLKNSKIRFLSAPWPTLLVRSIIWLRI